jgi:hypothetical protein
MFKVPPGGRAWELLTTRVPSDTVVGPVYWLAAARTTVPPLMFKPAAPAKLIDETLA